MPQFESRTNHVWSRRNADKRAWSPTDRGDLASVNEQMVIILEPRFRDRPASGHRSSFSELRPSAAKRTGLELVDPEGCVSADYLEVHVGSEAWGRRVGYATTGLSEAGVGPVADETEHQLVRPKRASGTDQTVRPDPERSVFCAVEGDLLETRVGEPRADRRGEIWRPTVPCPDHGATGGAQVWEFGDGPVNIVVADVAEHAADHHHVCGNGPVVGGRCRRVTVDDLYVAKPDALDRRSRIGHKVRIEFYETSGDVVATPVTAEYPDDIAALASAQADEPDRSIVRLLKGVAETALHDFQPTAQRRVRILVVNVPCHPMPVAAVAHLRSQYATLPAAESNTNRASGHSYVLDETAGLAGVNEIGVDGPD